MITNLEKANFTKGIWCFPACIQPQSLLLLSILMKGPRPETLTVAWLADCTCHSLFLFQISSSIFIHWWIHCRFSSRNDNLEMLFLSPLLCRRTSVCPFCLFTLSGLLTLQIFNKVLTQTHFHGHFCDEGSQTLLTYMLGWPTEYSLHFLVLAGGINLVLQHS